MRCIKVKKNKTIIIIIIIIIVAVFFFVFGYSQSQKIEDKEEKIMQAYQLLDDANKQWIRDKDEISKRSDIRKIRLKKVIQSIREKTKNILGKLCMKLHFH